MSSYQIYWTGNKPQKLSNDGVIEAIKKEIKNLNTLVRDPDFAGEIPHDNSCFFLQTPNVFLAGKIFQNEEERVIPYKFIREVDQRMSYFFPAIQFLIFMPRDGTQDERAMQTHDRRIHYFEYEILTGEKGSALSIKELRCPDPKACFRKLEKAEEKRTGFHFYEHYRLSREELEDLIQLSLTLKV